MIEHLWPKLTGNEWYSTGLRKWAYWLTTLGLGTMFITLTAAGLVDGFMALNLAPREGILQALRPFWLIRTLTGVSILLGFTCLAVNMAATAFRSRAAHVDTEYAPYEQEDKEAAVGTV
jgi:cytochrome c oxidase cbb3-type subunit 1